jgi:hypothetical protein
MNKIEAIEEFVKRDFNSVPQEWVKIVAEHESEYPNLPMWGTMWIVDNFLGEQLMEKSRMLVYDKEEIDVDSIEDEAERKALQARIDDPDDYMEEYVDEEMSNERAVLDKDGDPTAMFIYEIGDEYVVGIHGAGWNFYDGVWNRVYDTLGLKWHEEEK